jgi:hypothetical protein
LLYLSSWRDLQRWSQAAAFWLFDKPEITPLPIPTNLETAPAAKALPEAAMARITVEDCIDKVANRFELVCQTARNVAPRSASKSDEVDGARSRHRSAIG